MVVLAFGWRARNQSLIWADEERVWLAAVAGAPTSERSWVGLGSVYLKRREIEDARTAAERAVALAETAHTFEFLGLVHLERGNYQSGCHALEHARKLAGDGASAQLLNNLGFCYKQSGFLERALDLFGQARAKAPWFGQSWINNAAALDKAGRTEEAKQLLRTWLDRAPTDPRAADLLRYLSRPRR
jgi:tetratricopeptide (TPR) repeat protein